MKTIRGIIKKKYPPKGSTELKKSRWGLVEYEMHGLSEINSAWISGPIGQFEEGDTFESRGYFKENVYNGKSSIIFNIHNNLIEPEYPQSKELTLKYLSQHFTLQNHRIDYSSLAKMVDNIGHNALPVIFKDPNLLINTSDDKSIYANRIRVDLNRLSSNFNTYKILSDVGLPSAKIDSIINTYKSDAYSTMEHNPYEFIKMPKMTLSDVDKIAEYFDFSKTSYERVGAICYSFLTEHAAMGSTSVQLDDNFFSSISTKYNISHTDILNYITESNKKKDYSIIHVERYEKPEGTGYDLTLSLYDNSRNEKSITQNIIRLMENGKKFNTEDIKKEIYNNLQGSRLDEHQINAVFTGVSYPISIITGGPGTGKSTILDKILMFSNGFDTLNEVYLTAPTGIAAKRMEEATGIKATTLQMLLGMQKNEKEGKNEYRKNYKNKLPENSLIVIDEFSMVDSELFAALLEATPNSTRIVCIGDKDQLPSVGAGKVLADLLETQKDGKHLLPIGELINIYRQGENSKIATDSKLINQGIMPNFTDKSIKSVRFLETNDVDITTKIKDIYGLLLDKKEFDFFNDIIVISPQADWSGGTYEINRELSKLLNPNGQEINLPKKVYLSDNHPKPRIGDKVMLTENMHDEGVMNGDIGKLIGVKENENGTKDLIVEFSNKQNVNISIDKWDKLILAYAVTCHKSQGMQYPTVIMAFSSQHKHMMEKTLTYTGWTRAKDKVICIGDMDMFKLSIETNKTQQRKTFLTTRINYQAIQKDINPLGPPFKSRIQKNNIKSELQNKVKVTPQLKPQVKGAVSPNNPFAKPKINEVEKSPKQDNKNNFLKPNGVVKGAISPNNKFAKLKSSNPFGGQSIAASAPGRKF